MSIPAEKFMAPVPAKAAALRWLQDVPRDTCAPWVQALRETGAEAFASTGFPTTSWEGWQHTNLRPLSQVQFRYSKDPVKFDASKLPAPLFEGALRVVVVNGQLQSAPPGIRVMSLMEAKADGLEEWLVSVGNLADTPFKALNTAYLHDGFVMKVEGDITQPVEVLFYSFGDVAIHPRVLYWLGTNAGLTVFERHCGEGAYFANTVSEAVLGPDSRFKFYRLMQDSADSFHFSHMTVHQQKNSSFEAFSMALGARTARQEFQMRLIDSVISASINGIYLLKSQQNHDFTVLADHFEPDGKSEQYFKGVVDDHARAVFQGKIHIRRAAQRTWGIQSHHALLLSRHAEANCKPELEIYADDVKCSHGATSGHLDPVALFYLRSRGISEAEARALLIESFLNETVEKVSYAPAREIYRAEIAKWLKERQA